MAKRAKRMEAEQLEEQPEKTRLMSVKLDARTQAIQEMTLSQIIEAEVLRHMVRGTLRKPRSFRRG